MANSLTRSMTLAGLLCLPLVLNVSARAQSTLPVKDDVLDGLLKKLEDKDPSSADKPAEKVDEPKDKAAADSKPAAEVSGKDKDIDSLLEKLGASDDKPSPDDKKSGPGGPPQPGETPPADMPGKAEKKKPGALNGKDEDLDAHLEEKTGKRRKKNRQEEEAGSPLSDVIKQMREVEERLGKPDTGEETRKKQTQIVKRIDTLIEEMRSSQSQGKMRMSLAMKKGNHPGKPMSETPGTTGGNAPMAKPQKPTDKKSLAGGKDAWGHLPPEMRQEMENVFKEEPLPAREDLIRRYYLSVSKKTLTRGE